MSNNPWKPKQINPPKAIQPQKIPDKVPGKVINLLARWLDRRSRIKGLVLPKHGFVWAFNVFGDLVPVREGACFIRGSFAHEDTSDIIDVMGEAFCRLDNCDQEIVANHLDFLTRNWVHEDGCLAIEDSIVCVPECDGFKMERKWLNMLTQYNVSQRRSKMFVTRAWGRLLIKARAVGL